MTESKRPAYIMVHHSGVSYEKNPDQFRANNNYHQVKYNSKSSLGSYLGYNYEISKSGRASKAREDGENTFACYRGNMDDGRCIHICLDGNFDIENPAPEQIYKLRDMLREKCKAYGILPKNILFHKDISNTNCPGANMDKIFIQSLVEPKVVEEASSTTSQEVDVIIHKIESLFEELKRMIQTNKTK